MLAEQSTSGDAFEWDARTIRALRRYLGWSQNALARDLGIRQQTVSEWETGMYKPRGASVTILSLLARTAGFDPSQVEETEQELGRAAERRTGPSRVRLLAAVRPTAYRPVPGMSSTPVNRSTIYSTVPVPRPAGSGRAEGARYPSAADVYPYRPGEEVPM